MEESQEFILKGIPRSDQENAQFIHVLYVLYMSGQTAVQYMGVFFSAGQYWTENAETYESSFYRRSLDNDVYIVTATAYLNKSLDPSESECVRACVRPICVYT